MMTESGGSRRSDPARSTPTTGLHVATPGLRRAVLVAALTLVGVTAPTHGEAAGPWKAQIVDAESGQPLQGVVVLAYWIRSYASLGGWAGGEYYASEEVVTGSDGRFVIGARWAYTIPLVAKVSGPEFVIFKGGYGQWRFRGAEGRFEPGMGRFEKGEEVVIEMPPLKTREERLKFHRRFSRPTYLVPFDHMTRLTEAYEEDLALLGLGK